MNAHFYKNLTDSAINGERIDADTSKTILESSDIEILPLLNAAYQVRKNFTGKDVSIHIINNSQNGFCPEDCHYCAQAKTSTANIESYPLKSDEEILSEAENAYKKGAHRYCMVFAGRGPTQNRIDHLANLIKKIKSRYPLEVCVSAGLLDDQKAQTLKDAGLDRYNHNLNSSEKHYANICTTHTFGDRMNTLRSARKSGLQVCSGIIVGMGESNEDILEVAYNLREIKAESIPVNFLIPIEGNPLDKMPNLTPEFCLRVLSLFRFINPKSEIRIAAGREVHLRSMEVMALYPANSLFLDGYLNVKGRSIQNTLQMIKDAGFTIKSDIDLDDLLKEPLQVLPNTSSIDHSLMKEIGDLRPELIRK